MVDSPRSQLPRRRLQLAHGARRRAQQHHPVSAPLPTLSSGYAVGRTRTRPPPYGLPIPRLGRWLDGTARRGTAGSLAPLQAFYTSRVSSRFAGRAVTVQLVQRVRRVGDPRVPGCLGLVPRLFR